jgi:hypothetical protein
VYCATINDKRSFIETQMVQYHPFMDELRWYRDNIHKRLLILGKKNYMDAPVSIYTNFRDTLWHFDKFDKFIKTSNEHEAHVQYEMMLEHLNRAVMDALIDALNKMHIFHKIAANKYYKYYERLKSDPRSVGHNKKLKNFKKSKEGYLKAREALLLLRIKKIGLKKRPISAPYDFDNDADAYKKNTDYYLKIISLFVECYSILHEKS